jgi:hypothetical protein
MYRIETKTGKVLMNNLSWEQVVSYFKNIWLKPECFDKYVYDASGIRYKVGHNGKSWFVEPV